MSKKTLIVNLVKVNKNMDIGLNQFDKIGNVLANEFNFSQAEPEEFMSN